MRDDNQKKKPKIDALFERFAGNRFMTAALALFLALLAVFLYLVIQGFVSLSFFEVIKLTSPGADSETIIARTTELSGLAGSVANAVALSAVFTAIYIAGRKIRTTLRLASPSPFSLICCILLGISFNFFASVVISVIPFPQFATDAYNETYSFIGRGNIFIEVVGIVFVAPVVEEVVFRGICYGIMRRRMSTALAVIISSVLFAAAHGNLISFVYITVMGILLAVLFEVTRSLFIPIALHMAFNASSYFIPGLPDKTPPLALTLIIISSALLCALALTLALMPYRKSRIRKTQSDDSEIGE